MRKTHGLLALLFLSLTVLSARAELTIEITHGVDNPTVIAVSPIESGQRILPEDISQIVSADLERSGTGDRLRHGTWRLSGGARRAYTRCLQCVARLFESGFGTLVGG